MKQKTYTLKASPEIIIPDYVAASYNPDELQEIDITSYRADRAREAERLPEVRSMLIDHIDGLDLAASTLEDMSICLAKDMSYKEMLSIALRALRRASKEAKDIHSRCSK